MRIHPVSNKYIKSYAGITVFLSGEGDMCRRSRSLTVAGHQRTRIISVGREASNCERARLGRRLGERGEGGRTGESVVYDDSILQGDRRRRPGEIHFSLSSNCKKFVRSTTGNYCGKQIIFSPQVFLSYWLQG